jgi:hypothetical protein
MVQIQALFCNPPIAVARLGESSNPMPAFGWSRPENPRTSGETIIAPRWSFEVLSDGSVQPFLADSIQLKDGGKIRPICPFIELWAWLGDSGATPDQWSPVPLTEQLLAQDGAAPADISIKVTARNLKAARRSGIPELAFGTFPPLSFSANDHAPKPLNGVSHPDANPPMIPQGRTIPLGSVQMIRPRTQPELSSANAWVDQVDISVLRLRFTPPAGFSYGPNVSDDVLSPTEGTGAIRLGPAVQRSRAFLNPDAGWFDVDRDANNVVVPADTVDALANDRSLGVVDDTSECRIEFLLPLGGRALKAQATIMVAPPDFAPDRRPFYSLADEINDLAANSSDRSDALNSEELEQWVGDLFERVFETADLLNLDRVRNNNGVRSLQNNRLAAQIPDDGLRLPATPMGGQDALRNRDYAVPAPSGPLPLPLTRHARERHRALSDIQALRDFVAGAPDRLRSLVRGPFERELLPRNGPSGRDEAEGLRRTTMRMPPFMAQSTPSAPLTLTAWQYSLLMQWLDSSLASNQGFAIPDDISDEAKAARANVLDRPETQGLAW